MMEMTLLPSLVDRPILEALTRLRRLLGRLDRQTGIISTPASIPTHLVILSPHFALLGQAHPLLRQDQASLQQAIPPILP
jgi:hypothetical protein